MSFNPVPKRGKGIKDKDLLQFIKLTVGRCEWPDGCSRMDSLAAHHIFGRGSGGSKRNDDPRYVAVLCARHHNMGSPCAHDAEHWNRDFQARLQIHVVTSRTTVEWETLWAYMEEKGHPREPFRG